MPQEASRHGPKPPLKWAGGKRWLVPHLKPLWQSHAHRRLVEPLCGSLVVTLRCWLLKALHGWRNLMYSFRMLQITGYRAEPVPNTFHRQDDEARHVAILLPGVAYTCQMPLLYYPTRLLLALGADVLWVEYAHHRRADFLALSDSERERWFITDVSAACQAALAQRPYQQITLIGKSMGTLAMGHLLTSDARLVQARAIWLTPLLRNSRLRAQIQQSKPRSLFVIGTADSHYDPAHLAEMQKATGGDVSVIDRGDHSLEIEGDIWRSLQAIEQVMRAIQVFLTG